MADKTTRIKEAQKYLAKGQLDKAIGEWEKLVKEYPDGNNFNFLGDLYLKKGNKKSAVESFHAAANIFRREGFSLKALALFKKVLNSIPADAAALYALGELSEEKGLITDALKYYLATADSLAKEGKKDELFDIYGKILSLSPSNIPLRIKVAEILSKEGLQSAAAKEYLYIAGIYVDKGDVEKSKEYYQKTIDLQPLNRDAVMGLINLHEKTGETGRAMELMKEAAVLFCENVDVLLRAAELSLSGNAVESAKLYLSGISALEPGNAKAHSLLGEMYLKEGLKEKAWEEYLVALDALQRDAKYADAIKLLERVGDIDPLETHKRLVSIYRHLKDEPRVAEELTLLGDVYYDRGLRDEALACYSEAIEKAPRSDYLHERIAELKGEESPELAEVTETPETIKAGGKVSDHISLKAEKTLDEIFTEADIFVRYGLLKEAQELLEGLRLKAPENIDLHLRLKSVYTDVDDKESAVTECLILTELYKRSGDTATAEKVLREGFEISPSDPRLAAKGFAGLFETTSLASNGVEKFGGAAAGEGPLFADYEEELAEADFYTRQGLVQEALNILLKLRELFPENRDVAERLESLGEGPGLSLAPGTAGETGSPERTYVLSNGTGEPSAAPFTSGTSQGKEGPEEMPGQKEYQDFSFNDQEIMEAQEMQEPTLDNDVLGIFQEFKKGLENELEDEDSETHYNLGIAYKEMGLVDDAIKEFQTARKDKKRFLQTSSMLGVCYMEKGLYTLAIDVLRETLDNMKERNESYWSIKYDLAEAYEKNADLRESLDLYTEVYGWNAMFRNISEKVSSLKTQASKKDGKEKPKEKKDRVSYL